MSNYIKLLGFFILLSVSWSVIGQNNNTSKYDYYKNRYKLNTVNQKIVDNYGEGFDSLYGLRNVRVVLNGVVYRGGANNYYHKISPRDNHNPLPIDGLKNLAKEGFSEAVYLYPINFESSPKIIYEMDMKGSKNVLKYSQNLGESNLDIYNFIKSIYDNIIDSNVGPIYIHCWNGWHQSGLMSAFILKQFCNYTSKHAMDYWLLNSDNVKIKRESEILSYIKDFDKLPEFNINDSIRSVICPCDNEIDFHKNNFDFSDINKEYPIYNLVFNEKQTDLIQSSKSIIEPLVNTLNNNTQIKYKLYVKTGNEFNESYRNINRAGELGQLLLNYLIGNGVEKERIFYEVLFADDMNDQEVFTIKASSADYKINFKKSSLEVLDNSNDLIVEILNKYKNLSRICDLNIKIESDNQKDLIEKRLKYLIEIFKENGFININRVSSESNDLNLFSLGKKPTRFQLNIII